MRSFSILFVAFIFCFAIGNLKGRYLLVEVDQETEPTSVSFRSGDTCERPCPLIYQPVCGSDGLTYGNECSFDYKKCENPSLTLKHNGACKEEKKAIELDRNRPGYKKGIGESCTLELRYRKDCGECADTLFCLHHIPSPFTCGRCTLKLEKNTEKEAKDICVSDAECNKKGAYGENCDVGKGKCNCGTAPCASDELCYSGVCIQHDVLKTYENECTGKAFGTSCEIVEDGASAYGNALLRMGACDSNGICSEDYESNPIDLN